MHTKLLRASVCQSDLRENGIDLDGLDRGAAREFVRQNLDYFQAMLGYDALEREVYSLIRRAGAPEADGRSKRAHWRRLGRRRPPGPVGR